MTTTATNPEVAEALAAPGGRLLEGKRLVITGVATRQSIAFEVARNAQLLGAEVVLTSFGRMQRLTARAAKLLPDPPEILELDVNEREDFARLREELAQKWDRVDGVLHAIAYAPPDAIGGNFMSTPRESAELAFSTSAYSLKALAEAVAPLMTTGGSIVALDFDAAKAWPSYDWMGVSKAALEAVGRYLARELGPARIRVNLVACGPLKTVAARGIPNFDDLTGMWAATAPLGWDTEAPELVAGPVCFLLSDLAAAITGEILHVDGGVNAVGAPVGSLDGPSDGSDG